jgi:hypothetical protein
MRRSFHSVMDASPLMREDEDALRGRLFEGEGKAYSLYASTILPFKTLLANNSLGGNEGCGQPRATTRAYTTLLANDKSGGNEGAAHRGRPQGSPLPWTNELGRRLRGIVGATLVVALAGLLPPRCACSFIHQQSLSRVGIV